MILILAQFEYEQADTLTFNKQNVWNTKLSLKKTLNHRQGGI